MQQIQQHISAEQRSIDEWARMLVAPQDHLARAPASTPFLCSKARFVRSYDIPYSDTIDGSFAVVATSSVEAAVIKSHGPLAVFPQQAASFANVNALLQLDNTTYFSGSMIRVQAANGTALTTTRFVDGAAVHVNFTGIPVLRIVNPAATTVKWLLKAILNGPLLGVYIRMGFCDSATGLIVWQAPIIAGSESVASAVISAEAGVVFQLVSQNLTPISRPSLGIDIHLDYTACTVPANGTTTNFDLIDSELLSAGKVGNRRCTAISMLVSNMAPPLISGGELVIARCPASVISSADPETIMDTIKQLPEERYWRSGPIKEGGYAWWLPDDLASYEPTSNDIDMDPQNILVAAGKMSDEGGLVRVLITFTYEFYTPVQLFDRAYGPTYVPYSQTMWNELILKPAVSGNFSHAALIAGALGLVNTLSTFYNANKQWLQPVLNQGAKAVHEKMVKVAEKRKEQNKANKAKKKENKGKAKVTGAQS